MTLIGKNTDFVVEFDCAAQAYTVFYKNKFLIKKHQYADIKSYLN